MIEAQARLTRDIWLAVYLARAGARGGDLATVEAGADLLAGLFERFWDTAHPTLEEYGIEGRKGACESLVRIGEFIAPLRRVPLVVHARLGEFSGADFERFAAEGASAAGYGQFRGAIADTPVDTLAAVIDRLGRIEVALRRADAILSEQASAAGQTGTNFQPTYDAIAGIVAAIGPYAGRAPEPAAEVPAGDVASVPAAMPGGGGAVPGRIETREDATRALDAVIDYFSRVEPTSPVPVALGRIKGWITMDFMAILNDIVPGSVGDATNVLRTRAGGDANHDSDMM